jgi:hypothetical protein
MRLSDLAVGEARIDLEFERVQHQVLVAPVRDTDVRVDVRL